MIVFDLKCGAGHVFEAWFGSTAAYDAQRDDGQVRCPVCDDSDVGKAIMAPAIGAKGNRQAATLTPTVIKSAMQMLAKHQARLLESSEWVGTGFADRARAMHLGEQEQTTIHGQASVAEAEALVADGIAVTPLPLPIVPPKLLN